MSKLYKLREYKMLNIKFRSGGLDDGLKKKKSFAVRLPDSEFCIPHWGKEK